MDGDGALLPKLLLRLMYLADEIDKSFAGFWHALSKFQCTQTRSTFPHSKPLLHYVFLLQIILFLTMIYSFFVLNLGLYVYI